MPPHHHFTLQWMEARSMFQKAADLIQAEHRLRKSMWGQFWSAHQRFFKYLCISAKVFHCVALAREAVKAGKVRSFGVLVKLLELSWCSISHQGIIVLFSVNSWKHHTPKWVICAGKKYLLICLVWNFGNVFYFNEFAFCLQCVVIGLQSTGEARTLEQVEEMGGELNDFVSTAKWGFLLFFFF